MKHDRSSVSQPLRDALRHYLARHPEAADSPEGIRQWWLPEALRNTSLYALQLAMQELVAMGEMQCTKLPDGTELYAGTAGRKND